MGADCLTITPYCGCATFEMLPALAASPLQMQWVRTDQEMGTHQVNGIFLDTAPLPSRG